MKRIYLQKAKNQIARSNTIRDINRQIVLNYVRERSPLSRADIARETDLQRSTVSAIVDELVANDLIEEIGTGDSSGGRRPTLLRLKGGKPMAIGVSVTPTETFFAVADLTGAILDTDSFPTDSDSAQMTRKIIKTLKRIGKKYPQSRFEVGVCVPGITDPQTRLVSFVPYFDWKEWNVCAEIEEATGWRVNIDNDANAVALAESWFGKPEAQGIGNFITVLVGEGIGTGIFFEGQIYRGFRGAAGEFGHMFIGRGDGIRCSCGSTECWEAIASNTATVSRFNQVNGRRVDNLAQIVELAGNNDKTAVSVINDTLEYLGLGILNLIVGLSPEAIIICGDITTDWTNAHRKIRQTIAENIKQKLPDVKIFASTLGSNPTLSGAIALSLIKNFVVAR